MTNHPIRHLSCLCFAILFSASTAHAERMEVGAVTKIQNDGEAVYADSVRKLELAAPVLFEDLLRTGTDARLLAALIDGTELTLGENAALVVDAFVYDPDQGTGELVLSVLEGAFLFVGGLVEQIPGVEVRINTEVATLGVRGTTVWGGPTDGGYGIMVIDGIVDVESAGSKVTIEAGQATIIKDAQSAPDPARLWDQARVAAAVATVIFAE